MDAAHWHQGLGLFKPMEEMLMAGNPNPNQNQNPAAPGAQQRAAAPPAAAAAAPAAGATAGAGTERRARPQKEKALNCPRCNSTNTKFCYYNNYSLQQPRYFCKTCRRYWTEGGSLRNVPVGGGSRKNKRSSSSVVSSAVVTTAAAMSGTGPVGLLAAKNPKLMHEVAQDLNLAFPHHNGRGLQPPEFAAFPSLESSSVCSPAGAGMVGNGGRGVGAFSAMEQLRSTGSYVPLQHVQLGGMPAEYASSGFALGKLRMPPPPQSHQSVLGFSLDTNGTGGAGSFGGYRAGVQDNAAGRLLFPFEDFKPAVSAAGSGVANTGGDHQYEHNKDQQGDGRTASGVTAGHETPGFWNGGGGPW